MNDIRALLDAYPARGIGFTDLMERVRSVLENHPRQAAEALGYVAAAHRVGRLDKDEHDALAALIQAHRETATAGGSASAGEPADEATVRTDRRPQTTSPATSERPAGAAATPLRMDVGATLKSRFVLEALIGRGGMGKVFVARDKRKEEVRDRDPYIAVKILTENFKQHPEAFIALAREAKKSQKLAHPNIVTVYDFDRDEDNVFMTMEFLKGSPLNQLMKKAAPQGLERDRAMSIIEQMGEALAYAHKRHIVHSDFKPGNVFVTDEGVVKVLDFGIARAAKTPDQAQDATIFDAGSLGALTPAYATIDMMEGADPDPRDDIYALACVSYELLKGQHPFDKTPSLQAKIRGMKPQPIDGLSKRQWKALLRGLAFDREQRTPDAREFVDELLGRKKSTPTGWMAAAVVVLSALVGSAVYYLRPPPAPPPAQVATPAEQPPAQPGDLAQPLPPPEPEPPVVVLDEEAQAKVDRLLLIAEAHMLVGRLVEPPGSSAYDAYREVLSMDPRNPTAKDGLHQIADQLYELAVERIGDGDLAHGRQVIEVGLRVDPRHPKLRELQARHP